MGWLTILLALLPGLLSILMQLLPLLQKATDLNKLKPRQRAALASAAKQIHAASGELTRLGMGPDSDEVRNAA